jgi:hypothetical protein
MSPTEKENLNLVLEAHVDKYGLKVVLATLGAVAEEKAAHIAENWQDVGLAKLWSKRADTINAAAATFNDPIVDGTD